MSLPGVPGEADDELVLPCGEELDPHDLDLGMREYSCPCGATHAVVMDVHPLGRFVPEFLVDTLRETIATDDEYDEFSMPHVLAMIREEYPDEVASADLSGDGHVGYGLVWMTDFGSRELHEKVVEEVVDLMEHAISHAEDGPTAREFEQQLEEFELEAFVEAYRQERDFDSEYDTAP
jgi:hypothetical protein